MTTPLETFRATLATAPDGDIAVTIPSTPTLLISVKDFATALDVTRITTPIAPPVPAPVVAYQLIVVTTDLRVHSSPTLAAAVVGDVLLNDVVDVYTDAPVTADGHTWLHVHSGVLTGWCVDDYLKQVPVTPIPSPTPAPAPIPVTIDHQAYVSSGPLRVRAAGSSTAVILGSLATNAVVSVYSDPPVVEGTLTWVHIKSGTLEGWCAAKYLTTNGPVAVPVPVPTPVTPKHRFGLHMLQDGRSTVESWLNSLPPGAPIPTMTVVNDADAASAFAARGIKVVYRFEDGGEAINVPDDPGQAEAYGHQVVKDRVARGHTNGLDKRCYWQIENETIYSKGHPWFWLGVLAEIRAHGFHAVLGAYGVGHVEDSEMQAMIPALRDAKAHGDVVALHAYCQLGTPPGQLSTDGYDYELRFLHLYNAIPADARAGLIISEFQGEYNRGAFQGTAALLSLCHKFELAIANADYLLGYNIWTVGKAGGWADACIDSALPALAQWGWQ